MAKKKRHRVPEVLRRAFGDRARTLEETLLSLLQKPLLPRPAECRCRGRGCLGCGGSSFLLRQEDGPDYRRLLNRCFCAVSSDAPEPDNFLYRREWTQRLIVRNTMELLMDRSRLPDNVLCEGYDKRSRFSLNGELLCDSAWNLLLTRIGESAMTFLLNFSSIFVSLPTNNHFQAAGPSLNKYLQNLGFSQKPASAFSAVKAQQALQAGDHVNSGCRLKRERMEFEEKQGIFAIADLHHRVSLPVHDSVGSVYSEVYGKLQESRGSFNWNRHKKHRIRITEACLAGNHLNSNSNKDKSNIFLADNCSTYTPFHSYFPICSNLFDEMAQASLVEAHKSFPVLEESSRRSGREFMKGSTNSTASAHVGQASSCCSVENGEISASVDAKVYSISEFCNKSRKRRRLFSWQRRRKFKKANTLDDNSNTCSTIVNPKESSSKMFSDKSTEEMRSEVDQVSELVNRYSADIADNDLLDGNTRHNDAINCVHSGKLFDTNMTLRCFNCSMLQCPPKVTGRVEIRRKHMFYSSGSSPSIFPGNHILNILKPNNFGANVLMKHIFSKSDGSLNTEFAPCFNCDEGPTVKSGCLYHSLLRILKALIRNAHKCHRLKFLRRHCSVPNFRCHSNNKGHKSEAVERKFLLLNKLEKTHAELKKSSENLFSGNDNTDVSKQKEEFHESYSGESDLQNDQSGSYCQHEDVVSFLWAATRSMVPVDLLGDSANWRALRRNISKFVRLQRFEMFRLRQCIHGLQTSKFSFLSRIPNHHICHCFNRDGSRTTKNPGKFNNNWIALKHKLFHSWIYWFFSYMIVPLLGANFYITEKESGRHEVFYYPKPVWSRLVARTISRLKEQNYRPVDFKQFKQIVNRRPFGFSKVRFLPKAKGVRLLANLKAPSKAWMCAKSSSGQCIGGTGNNTRTHLKPRNSNGKRKLVHFRSVNSTLHDIYAILSRIKINYPQMLGASVFDYGDIYRKLHKFLLGLKNGSTIMPKVFVVVSDVSKAFDSINQDKLLDVMKDVMQKEEYHVRKCAHVICTKKSMRTLYCHFCFDQSKDNNFVDSLASIRSRSSHSVLIDQGIDRKIKQVDIQNLLHEHVKTNMLQLGQGFYLQKSGIAQGSLLSSLLCSFYYGHLERTVIFPFLEKNYDLSISNKHCKELNSLNVSGCLHADRRCSHLCLSKEHLAHEGQLEPFDLDKGNKASLRKSSEWHDVGSEKDKSITDNCFLPPRFLLLRLIDDFLFISTSRRQATGFFNRLCRGFREYNCFMNREKFGLNFDVDSLSHPMPNRRYVGADGVPFLPWSGLLVNCLTLEIQADYTRYLGTHLRSTLTVHAGTKHQHLEKKLCNYMRPKCHPIFYDSNINSPAVVTLNAYQAFLLCAMKFHCYFCTIPNSCDLGPTCCLEIIQKSFSYMHRLIKKRMYGLDRTRLNINPVLKLKKAEILWLGLSAYIRVLRKKQSRHAKLLLLLKAEIDSLGKIDCDPSPLRFAVDDSHSSMFWKIKY